MPQAKVANAAWVSLRRTGPILRSTTIARCQNRERVIPTHSQENRQPGIRFRKGQVTLSRPELTMHAFDCQLAPICNTMSHW